MASLSPLLVDAKKEYTLQLAELLTPYVMNTIARIYENSKKNTKAFREMLRQVPNWNASSIEERTNEIERRNPQLADLIAACCVSYTKVLGSIRLNASQNSNVRIALPQTAAFVHGVYVYMAKEFFYDPKLAFADRHAKAVLMTAAVEEAVRQHVPIQQLLKAYLSVAVDASGIDPMAASRDQQHFEPQAPPMSPPMSPPAQHFGFETPPPQPQQHFEPPPLVPQFQQHFEAQAPPPPQQYEAPLPPPPQSQHFEAQAPAMPMPMPQSQPQESHQQHPDQPPHQPPPQFFENVDEFD